MPFSPASGAATGLTMLYTPTSGAATGLSTLCTPTSGAAARLSTLCTPASDAAAGLTTLCTPASGVAEGWTSHSPSENPRRDGVNPRSSGLCPENWVRQGDGMVRPAQTVQVEFPPELLSELDATAAELQLSREAAVRVLVRQALDAHYLARKARRAG